MSRLRPADGGKLSRSSRHSCAPQAGRARTPTVRRFGQNANYLKHNRQSSVAGGGVLQKSWGIALRRVRRQYLRDARIEEFASTGDFARYSQQNQHQSLLTPRTVSHKSGWRDCIREPVGERKNVKIIHKTPFSGVSCTIFRRLWITFWITHRTRCAWVWDNLRICPQGVKTVQSCSWDTRCLSIQFSIGQLSVYTVLTVVIHRSEPPLLTTTMYTYSKPIKTLKPCYERRKNRKTRSA